MAESSFSSSRIARSHNSFSEAASATTYGSAERLHRDDRHGSLVPELPSRDDLMKLADQLQSLANELKDRQERERAIPLPSHQEADLHTRAVARANREAESNEPSGQKGQFLALARARYEARRKREAVFGNQELFGEPAWDILLDLYIAHAEGKSVSVSSACIGSASPPTTGLRWLGVLQEAGLVEREHDPRDQRRVLVRLSTKGVDRMETYFRDGLS